VALGLLVLTAGPAAAHTEILRAEPAPGAAVTGVVDEVTLVFLDPIGPELTLLVRDDAGAPVAGLGDPVVRDGDTVAEVGFDPLTEAGGYVVDVRYVALDGDTQRRTHRFTYEPPALDGQPLPRAPSGTEASTVVGMAAVAAALAWSGASAVRRRRKGLSGPAAK
jgi:methionine-rich copper-binding protein CopC